ncbi:MAG TPA: MBL fold metallo-hydrolase [Rhizobiaceae bacterium]|nr:MBL fold metallo-hydrolase [Rhizobiaceae bacterium]
MKLSRRSVMKTGIAGLVAFGAAPLVASTASAQDAPANTIPVQGGQLVIHPVSHASLVLVAGDTVIYADPVGEASAYQSFPPPDLIVITHEHSDHFNADTLSALVGEKTKLITNPAVFEKLPEKLRGIASPLANGEKTEAAGIAIEAIPAHNTTPERLQYHPKGRDNGYILTLAGARVYLAGDTEDIPEMRALKNIALAFVPMNLPYTMTVEQAASAVNEFKPKVVYPYHYNGSDVEQFKRLVEQGGGEIEVRLAKWY